MEVKNSRTINARKHSKMRFVQRLGLSVTTKDLKEIARIIMNNKGEFVKRKSLRVSIFKVPFRGEQITVYYDRSRHTVLTVLPLEHKE